MNFMFTIAQAVFITASPIPQLTKVNFPIFRL
ncbi:MAG: hypothetical protein MRERV_1c153 [Mycoplasmataceae bacterium RV_VA103A]|nr:MAG: hypothetical protein MRERV_1c153 [Mycoplasmataceae bacterium RV_VA103A]